MLGPSMAEGWVSRIIDLREGEAKPALFTGGVLALLVGAHTILETARDALFLQKLPPSRLTLVYVFLAVLSLAAGSLTGAFARQFGRKAALVFTLICCAYGTSVFYLRPTTPLMVFCFYLLSGVIGTVLLLQFWMFASQLFTVAQGKRLFGPIAGGGVIGATVGASVAAALLRVMHVKGLLLVGGALFLVAAAVLTQAPSEETRPAQSTSALDGLRAIGALRRDGYIRRVAVLTALGTATVLVVDYLFKSVAAATLDKQDLGSFFAVFYAAQNGLSLVVQLFLTGFLVSRFGVLSALVVLPVLLVLGGLGSFAFGASLVAAMVSKGADGSLRHSLNRVSNELLLLPLSAETRERAKPLLDTVFGRGIQALTAGLIMLAAAAGVATPRRLGAAVVVLAVCWVASAIYLRRPYVDLFRRALSLGVIERDPRARDLDLDSVEALLQLLSSDDEERALAAIEHFEATKRTRLVPGLVLYHPSPRVLVKALNVIGTKDRTDWIPHAERLLDHPEVAVRTAAVHALASSDAVSEEIVVKKLADESEVVRAEAIFFLARRHGLEDPGSDDLVRGLLDASGKAAERARAALLSVIGNQGDECWAGVVTEIVEADSAGRGSEVAAAMAIRRIGDPKFLPWLVSRLAVRDGRGAVREAIVSLGPAAFVALARALEDPETESRIKLHIPRTMSRFGNQEAVDYLTKRLAVETNGAIRFKILRGVGRLSTEGKTATGERLKFDRAAFEREVERNLLEHFRLMGLRVALDVEANTSGSGVSDVLRSLLDDKLRQSLERTFRFLGLAHRNEDIRGVYAALLRGDRRARANALEFLDALPMPGISVRQLLRIVADDLAPRERVRRATTLVPREPPRTREIAVRALIDDADDLVATLAAYAALDMGLVALRAEAARTIEARPAFLRRRESVSPMMMEVVGAG